MGNVLLRDSISGCFPAPRVSADGGSLLNEHIWRENTGLRAEQETSCCWSFILKCYLNVSSVFTAGWSCWGTFKNQPEHYLNHEMDWWSLQSQPVLIRTTIISAESSSLGPRLVLVSRCSNYYSSKGGRQGKSSSLKPKVNKEFFSLYMK